MREVPIIQFAPTENGYTPIKNNTGFEELEELTDVNYEKFSDIIKEAKDSVKRDVKNLPEECGMQIVEFSKRLTEENRGLYSFSHVFPSLSYSRVDGNKWIISVNLYAYDLDNEVKIVSKSFENNNSLRGVETPGKSFVSETDLFKVFENNIPGNNVEVSLENISELLNVLESIKQIEDSPHQKLTYEDIIKTQVLSSFLISPTFRKDTLSKKRLKKISSYFRECFEQSKLARALVLYCLKQSKDLDIDI